CCGYNLKKSVEELLMISSNTLEKGKAVGYDDMRKSAGKGSKMEKFPYEDCYPNSLSSVRFYFSPRPIPVYGRSCMIPGAWGVLMHGMPLCWLACTKEKRGQGKNELMFALSSSALRYLKLVIGADGEDRKQGKKRRLV
ncbi:hypothetical protein BHE74_00030739, partial [Ensete ventricosum]